MTTKKRNIKDLDSIEVSLKKVLVAPLNWGLGHATRVIPIIHLLLQNNFTPVLASDGEAFKLLKKEFPNLEVIELPSYRIEYAKSAFLMKWKLVLSFWSIKRAVRHERKIVNQLVSTNNFVGLISDNRFGIFHKDIPSVYITHQLNVYSGWTSEITSRIHQKIISKHTVCWVPDSKGESSLSGALSVVDKWKFPTVYIGKLSRLLPENLPIKYDVLLLLSGPEPQRSILEHVFLREFSLYKGRVLLIRGVLKHVNIENHSPNIEVINYLKSKELQGVLNSSELVVCRSGYSTIMDLEKLNKKAFFIPTPGQSEQNYLARNMDHKRIAPFCEQKDFTLDKLKEISAYTGFLSTDNNILNPELLKVFKSS